MEIRLNNKESIRLTVDHERNNFIDVSCEDYEMAGGITLFPSMQYVEIRKKGGYIKIFTFKKKSHKKEIDFGYWKDAEVIFAINEVIHK